MPAAVVFLVAVLMSGAAVPFAYFTDKPGAHAMETCLKFKERMYEQFGRRHRYECLPGDVEKKK